jgi:Reverse transcriptase (RNA-dependent DNA polymerase).
MLGIKKYSETFLDETQSGFRKGCSCVVSALTLKILLEKRREYNSERHFLFVVYEEAFDEVRRLLLFSILQERYILNLLHTAVIKIHEDNRIKIKLDDTLTQTIKINIRVLKGCPLSPLLFNMYIQ